MLTTSVDPIRSKIMSSVRSKDTKPEMIVRRALHALNYRYRLHRNDLPGSPDIVFFGRRKVIFVHGCFWHRHANCPKATRPKTRASFWQEKFDRNVQRDAKAKERLERDGWTVLVVWECETKTPETLVNKMASFLDGDGTAIRDGDAGIG